MMRPPRSPHEPIFSLGWTVRLSLISLLISLITLGVFGHFYATDPYLARASAFTALVVLELSKAFLLRVKYQVGLFSNFYLLAAVGISLLLQVAVLYAPVFHLPLQTTFLGWEVWSVIGIGLALQWAIGYPIIRSARPQTGNGGS
jgi:Ca2+-transporting ATPase